MSETKPYREIIKTTSIYGSTKVFQILINILRNKLIAILLGPAGMGIAGLFTSSSTLVGVITNFGLETSAVKNIAEENSKKDTEAISRIVRVVQVLVWLTGLLGMISTIILSKYLSEFTFGSDEYTIEFIILSVVLLINQLRVGRSVVLRGTRNVKFLTLSSLTGALSGLLITIPLYYIWGVKGIVPAMILMALAQFVISHHFFKKIKLSKVIVPFKEVMSKGRGMVTMGITISFSGIISLSTSYLIKVFISHLGGVADVGLYDAGFTLIFSYAGLVLDSIATDYYPRLSEIAHDNKKIRDGVNQQTEIAFLLLAPLIIFFLVFSNDIVYILYSDKFLGMSDMILFGALSILFRTGSWSISFAFIAKGDSKQFFINELFVNIVKLPLNYFLYMYYGVAGLGLAMLIMYIFYMCVAYFVSNRKFGFSYSSDTLKVFLLSLLFTFASFSMVLVTSGLWKYILGVILFIVSLIYSYFEVDKRVGIKGIVKNIRKKFNGKSS